jgi:hypothetical protein
VLQDDMRGMRVVDAAIMIQAQVRGRQARSHYEAQYRKEKKGKKGNKCVHTAPSPPLDLQLITLTFTLAFSLPPALPPPLRRTRATRRVGNTCVHTSATAAPRRYNTFSINEVRRELSVVQDGDNRLPALGGGGGLGRGGMGGMGMMPSMGGGGGMGGLAMGGMGGGSRLPQRLAPLDKTHLPPLGGGGGGGGGIPSLPPAGGLGHAPMPMPPANPMQQFGRGFNAPAMGGGGLGPPRGGLR